MINFLMLACACGFTACSGIVALQEKQYNNIEEKIEFKHENKKLVSYDDTNYTITLTADELNTYSWVNFNNLFNDNWGLIDGVVLSYDDSDYEYTGVNSGEGCVVFDDLIFIYNNTIFNSANESEYPNYIWLTPNGDRDFISSLVIYCSSISQQYSSIKQAIELDIQANSSSTSQSMAGVLGDFITILVGGIQTLATGVANGVVSMATALFLTIDNGQVTGLSVFGGIVAIFAGLALAIGITTKVYTWVTSLGN